MILTIVLEILSSQCFFASVSYIIDIIKNVISNYLTKKYDYDGFYYKYAIYIQSIVASFLFIIIGITLYSVVDYFKN
ncbi:ORF MSV108 hypothetical protein [Melanoplus sanguinipes entomopoxvirus]|uniref:Viral membrane associated, early morphogenesis protein (Cop-A9L) n=1 Tax=Melanoplus sanguinipes entomopoxvirus TaxID=83191 RepID=Q9YVY4_MSEPV|nr:ORF MSV108 hypothetical protein [Melanoplus sanguinipes entomopoxvirus]AAC97654.1 ORF MSV108 hypothetical protein [Melanoplus sanguinipes entomopoxvirus 'O']